MGFGEAVAQVFKKYATFSGRARRSEYWYFILFYSLASMAIIFIEAFAGLATLESSMSPVSGVFTLAVFLPSLAVSVRRLHDIDRSGWWTLLILIPLVGYIVLLVFFVKNGTDGPNRFGTDPKGLGSVVEEF